MREGLAHLGVEGAMANPARQAGSEDAQQAP